ncbi:MAG: PorT family protein [Chitinophagaceae bacterium]|nr:PorT family protein [Chitinophagaceae bacterium]
MKKIVVIAALLITGAASQAQVKFGVKAGANLANVSGDDVEGTDMKIGFHVGGLAEIPVSTMFSVKPEVVFSNQGWKEDDGKVNLAYLNIPVLLQYNNPSGFYAETGPQIGFLMSAKAKPDDGDDVDIKDLFKTTDFSWAFGAGFKTKSGFGFGARYNFGLSDIIEDAKAKNSVIALGVFYTFGGEKK